MAKSSSGTGSGGVSKPTGQGSGPRAGQTVGKSGGTSPVRGTPKTVAPKSGYGVTK